MLFFEVEVTEEHGSFINTSLISIVFGVVVVAVDDILLTDPTSSARLVTRTLDTVEPDNGGIQVVRSRLSLMREEWDEFEFEGWVSLEWAPDDDETEEADILSGDKFKIVFFTTLSFWHVSFGVFDEQTCVRTPT